MKSKKDIAQEVVTATQILNNAIAKAETAGMQVDISQDYINGSWRQTAKVFTKGEETIFAQTPKQDKKK